MFKDLKSFNLPEIEEKVLKFWKENRIFEKSLVIRKNRKKFVFFEGPPSANGQPGLHHVLARSFKDIILRYKTMAGFFVPRRGGWDTHGLPVELEVEKSLGLKSKKEIEKFGIAEFNKKCKQLVWKYKDEWEKLTERIGFWIDLDNPYITYENSYIETLWWIFKQIWQKKLLYKEYKVVPWCSRCGTILSSHELALGYKESQDNSIYVKFKLKPRQTIGNWKTGKKTYILSWTTTPWTLPGNVALAIGKKIRYVSIEKDGDEIWYAKDSPLAKELGDAGKEISGEALVGLEYEPLFEIKKLKSRNSYKIYPANFVETNEGTGVVHTAVMYGEDDYELGKTIGLPQYHTVDEKGNFTKDVPELAGLYVKDPKTEEKIINRLKTHNSLLKTEPYIHEYPFCWRCSTPILYYARDSWFIAMSKLRENLQSANQKINWIPEHIKNGRFGEWLKEAKDWAISRERYWGTPLPIWQCQKCSHTHLIGSFKELEEIQKKTNNKYIFLRHGEAENNLKNINDCWPEKKKYNLTLKGRIQAEKAAGKLKNYGINLIFASDLTRTKQTAQIMAKSLKIKKIFFDKRLREINVGIFNGQRSEKYHNYSSGFEKFTKQPPNGETLTELRFRIFQLFQEIEKKYKNKKILIISHEYPLWMLESAMKGWTNQEALEQKHGPKSDFLKTGEMKESEFNLLPKDEIGQTDVHRPYIDKINFPCPKCSGQMKRISEVTDVWFDSGAMPFAANHYPFNPKIDFPADYITEGIDQTRGWFYTLLAIAILLDKKAPYKNVISLGLLLDKNGQKMSKSKGNIVDPWQMIQKYGSDAVRWYFYTINSPGEPKSFNEEDLAKTLRQFILLIYNSFIFFETYGNKKAIKSKNLKNSVLDRWIISRLNEVILETTKKLEKYEITETAKIIEEFAADLSRWYIRRSRRRFQKPDNKKDYQAASQTLGQILIGLSQLLAPFTPFFSEALYKSLKKEKKSVHLENWPKANRKLIDKKLLAAMVEIRQLASLGLAKRAEAGIKVRQPIASLKIKNQKSKIKNNKELLKILADEINVKNIIFDPKIKDGIELDTTITPELREEGIMREFIRMIQNLRQKAGYEPKDKIYLFIELQAESEKILNRHLMEFKKEVGAKNIEFKRTEKFDIEIDTQVDSQKIWVGIKKV